MVGGFGARAASRKTPIYFMSCVFAVMVYRALLISSPSLGDGELLISWPSVGDGELLPSSSESFLSAARLPIIVVVVVVVRKVPEEV